MTKGVRLRGVTASPRDEGLESRLAGCWGPVFGYQKIDSAMDMAHELASEGSEEGTLVYAVGQEHGRGRQGRAWASPEGGAYFAIIARPLRSHGETPQLSLLAGLAAAEAVQALADVHPSIRWPNDLIVDGKKLAGILVEAKKGGVVIGIGINAATKPEDLPDVAVSLAALGKPQDPVELAKEVCRRFSGHYRHWSKQGFAPFRDVLRPWIGMFGQPVHVTAGNDYFEGTAQDLDERGRLVVRLDSGVQRAFEVGEVTLLRSR